MVSSELVPDIINGLVAAGTLALAGATVYVGRAAARAALDAASPRVVVRRLEVADQPVSLPLTANAGPQEIDAGLKWSMAQHGQDRIGLVVNGNLYNEGSATALFRFELDADCQLESVTRPITIPPDVPEQDGWFLLEPGGIADFAVIWWQAASTWAYAWERPAAPETPPTSTMRLIVRGTSGDTSDRCDFAFGGYVIVPHPREDGWVIAAVDRQWRTIPGTVPQRTANIGLMRRAYRLLPTRRPTGRRE